LSVLLDTHIWIRWLLDAEPLPHGYRDAFATLAAEHRLNIAAISIWEAQMLHAKRRLPLTRPFESWIREATDSEVVGVLALDVDVIVALDRLPTRFHGDPADRIIVATARAHGLPLVTLDKTIRRARLVELWKPLGSR
jgi:PIN domain nuclease of toxin-antitoxin system